MCVLYIFAVDKDISRIGKMKMEEITLDVDADLHGNLASQYHHITTWWGMEIRFFRYKRKKKRAPDAMVTDTVKVVQYILSDRTFMYLYLHPCGPF